MKREQWERSTFGGTHRPLGNRQTGHSQRQLSEQASFDHAGPPGCLLIMVSTIIAAVLGVIFNV